MTYNPETSICLSDLGFLSPDGISYSFDKRANGYARGEGFGILILKSLSKAIRDGDTIRAVVRATGSNQDGRTPGITQPSMAAQEALIRETYQAAGLDMGKTAFVEAHATGTSLGDPTEAAALGNAFRDSRHVIPHLHVGAVKSNIGHLEGASGVAGLIKTVLALEKAIIPPNVWPKDVSKRIQAEYLKLKVCCSRSSCVFLITSTSSFLFMLFHGRPMGFVDHRLILLASAERMHMWFLTMLFTICVSMA